MEHAKLCVRTKFGAKRNDLSKVIAVTVESAARTSVGTTVTLHMTPGKRRYLDRGRLERIVRTYADFLGVPVYIDDVDERGTAPVNAVHAPWHQ